MSKKKKVEEHEEIVDVSKAEQFIENNVQKLLIGLAALVLLAAAFIFISQNGKGKERKAEAKAVKAQEAFTAENWTLAIEGDDSQIGFQEIADSYKGTKIGNLAQYYLGTANMKLGNFEQAAEHLKKFNTTADPNVSGLALMNLGDALSELGKNEEALGYYKKAANTKSEAFQGDFMYRYALAQINAEDFAGAKATLTKLKADFPKSPLATQADQYLAGL